MHTATLAATHAHSNTRSMLVEGQSVADLPSVTSERHPAEQAKSRAAVCLIGPWSPGDLFVTPAWGMLDVQALSCESGWAQTGSLGVKKRLGGWRNLEGTISVCACICLQYAHVPSGFPPARHIRLQREQSRPLWAPASQAFLAPSVLAAFVHLGTQTANVGVLQAVGVVCTETFSLPLLPGHPHTFEKHWPHTPGSKS